MKTKWADATAPLIRLPLLGENVSVLMEDWSVAVRGHEFVIQPGTGYAVIGEVSMCNDDNTDNRFEEVQGRFPTIEEDEPPYRLLCNEYPPAKD